MIVRHFFSIIASIGALTGIASAAEWQLATITWEQGNGYVLKSGHALYSTDTSKPGAAFACIERRLLTAFSTEPANLRESFVDEGPAHKIYVKWSINESKPKKERWVRLLKHNVLAVGDHLTSRKLFNAVGRGDRIEIQSRKYGDFNVDLPKPKASTFNQFIKNCAFVKAGATN